MIITQPIIKITRYTQDYNQTMGVCTILGDNDTPMFTSLSLERGWRENQGSVSCIPRGIYEVVLEYSPKFKMDLWEIKDVENRSECKFHSANFWTDLNGCIALGLRVAELNNDSYYDITNSKDTMRAFHKTLEGHYKATLNIECGTGIF